MLRTSALSGASSGAGARGAPDTSELRTGATPATTSRCVPSCSKKNTGIATSNPRNAATKTLLKRSSDKTRGM